MFITLVAFFAVLGILVLVHEAGHFFVARYFKVKVEEFGFGLPPRLLGVKVCPGEELKKIAEKDEVELEIFSEQISETQTVIHETVTEKIQEIDKVVPKKNWQFVFGKKFFGAGRAEAKAGTIYSLNWIPLGGFVKIKGEEGQAADEADSFAHQTVWRRFLIISAGVFMNIVLAAVILTFIFSIGSPQVLEDKPLPALARVSDIKIRVMEVLPDSPAFQAGLVAGDTILAVDEQAFSEIEILRGYFNQKVGLPVSLKIQRDGEILEMQATPIVLAETQNGGLGIALVKTGFVSYPWHIAWWYGISETFKIIGGVLSGFYLIIKNLIVSQKLIGEVYGPVGIATLVGDATKMGFLYLMQFTAVLSVIIAVINFLPFPALDGGRAFFLLLEAVRKKPINQQVENLIHNIGFALLMGLVVLVTFRDLSRLSSVFTGWWGRMAGLF